MAVAMVLNHITLGDGQRIYIVGVAGGKQMRELVSEYIDRGLAEWEGINETAKLQDRMARKYIAIYNHELWDWLCDNHARITGWADPLIFDRGVPNFLNFRYGIGFESGDPMETLFTLRWS